MNLATKLFVTARAVASHPLSARPGLLAVARFGLAQVSARLASGDVIIPFPNETKLVVPPRMKGAAHFIYPGLCEFEEMSFVAHFLRGDDLFVDVGANLGAYTLLAAGVAHAKACAIEPSPSTFARLKRTIELNGLASKVDAYNLAVGAKNGHLSFTEGLGTENHFCHEGSDPSCSSIKVEVRTLDELLLEKAPTFIKIDVEGFESDVMAGGQNTLRNPALLGMIIEKAGNANRFGFNEDVLHAGIRDLGFAPFRYEPLSRQLIHLGLDASGNVLYLRDADLARQRCQAAHSYHFAGKDV